MRLKNINELLYDMNLFESSLENFIDDASRTPESGENLQFLRDMIIICQRLYLSDTYKTALKSMRDILWESSLPGIRREGLLPGKIKDLSGRKKRHGPDFFRKRSERSLRAGTPVTLNFSRLFDGEYMIHTEIAAVNGTSVDIAYSDDMTKIREFRLPFVDYQYSCCYHGHGISAGRGWRAVSITGTMTKVNENEAYIQVDTALEIGKDYEIVFELSEFRFNVKSVLLSSRFSKITKYHDLLFKFSDLTGAGKTVLVKYITEKLSR
jgi:hypothetical protein